MPKAPANHSSASEGHTSGPAPLRAVRLSLRRALRLALLFALLLPAANCLDAEPGVLTEYQVKALFLLNFTKYIDWPAEAFAETNSPIVIGVIGENHFGDDLTHAIAGKTVNDRKIAIHTLASEVDWDKCHVLFISASERKRVPDILARLHGQPILTVGESDQFTEQGGVVNFIKRDGKIRLEIDLHAAQHARLQISSRLLSVADVVHGKP